VQTVPQSACHRHALQAAIAFKQRDARFQERLRDESLGLLNDAAEIVGVAEVDPRRHRHRAIVAGILGKGWHRARASEDEDGHAPAEVAS